MPGDNGWQVKNVYFYLVCLVTLMMVIFGLIGTLNQALEIWLPSRYSTTLMDMYLNEKAPYNRYEQSDKLKEHIKNNPPDWNELEKEREIIEQRQLGIEKAYKLRYLVGSMALFIIPLPFYYYHWKKIKPAGINGKGVNTIEN